MARLIDADALRDTLGVSDKDIEFAEMLDEQPTVDAEPVKRGEWEWSKYASKWKCSNCWHAVEEEDANIEYNYCPYCGAKMDEWEDES